MKALEGELEYRLGVEMAKKSGMNRRMILDSLEAVTYPLLPLNECFHYPALDAGIVHELVSE